MRSSGAVVESFVHEVNRGNSVVSNRFSHRIVELALSRGRFGLRRPVVLLGVRVPLNLLVLSIKSGYIYIQIK